MIVENIYAAKTNLSKLIQKVLQGEDIVIAKAGTPVVRLVPYVEGKKPLQYGTLKGQIEIADDFDAYSKEEAEMFSEYEPGNRHLPISVKLVS